MAEPGFEDRLVGSNASTAEPPVTLLCSLRQVRPREVKPTVEVTPLGRAPGWNQARVWNPEAMLSNYLLLCSLLIFSGLDASAVPLHFNTSQDVSPSSVI